MPQPKRLHLDYESFSRADIKKVGAYRYARDPSTEILCAAMALDDQAPVVWRQGMSDREMEQFDPYFDALENPEIPIYAFSAQMEIAMSESCMEKTFGIKPPAISRYRCIQSIARRANLPADLETLSKVLGNVEQKDKRGKALIKLFSVMQKADKGTKGTTKKPGRSPSPPRRIYPHERPAEFAEFMAYCAQDVKVDQSVLHRLEYFEDAFNDSNFTLTATINNRGVPVNISALYHAQELVEKETKNVSELFLKMFGFNITQGAVFLDWLHSRGCHLDNLQKETVETFLEEYEEQENDLVPIEVLALRMKLSVAFASIKKVATMLACAGPDDNRIRGMLNHYGAGTGRWTASLVQFQNMKRPTIKYSHDAYKAICAFVDLETLRMCYGPPLEVISSCIRHFVQDVYDPNVGSISFEENDDEEGEEE